MRRFVMIALLVLFTPAVSLAQDTSAPPATAPDDDPDRDINVSQPDFTVVNLPTTLRVPRHRGAFRITHRFGRPLGEGDFADLASDLFGLDSGAQIGLEFRFGLARGLQAGIHRTSDKTIELFGEYNVLQQGASRPIGLDVIAAIEGTDNLQENHSPSVGLIVSRELGRHGAIYVEPIWVGNSSFAEPADEDNTFMVGLGARLRVRPTVYVVGEVIPSSGFNNGTPHGTFGIEKRAGGHIFQLNFSNSFGTTMGQLARGAFSNDEWYLGFNISRKFF